MLGLSETSQPGDVNYHSWKLSPVSLNFMTHGNIDHYPGPFMVEMLVYKTISSTLDIGFNGQRIQRFAF